MELADTGTRFLQKDHEDHKGGETSWEDCNVCLGRHCLECVQKDLEGYGRKLEGSQAELRSLEWRTSKR